MYISFVALVLLPAFVFSKTIIYNWSIDFVTAAPAGTSRQVIGINGEWPCPAIEATVGDSVTVNVYNNLVTESTGLHFHGLDQRGTQVMDGPSGVTQCPIPPGSNFTYTFNIDRAGTYWYHSHNKGQYPDGLRGPLIVHDPNDPYAGQYDRELVMTTSDWYDTSVPVLVGQILAKSNTKFLPPFPNAILLDDNGVQNKTTTFQWEAGKTYKLEIISMAAFASTLIQFDSHTMYIIGVDGSYVAKRTAYQLRVSPAQRYTVLITASSSPHRNYAFLASLDINRDYTNTATSATYPFNMTGYIVYDDTSALPAPYVVHAWDRVQNDEFLSAQDGGALYGTPNKEITLDFNFGLDSIGIPRAYFNNKTYVTQKVPTLFTAFSAGEDNTNPLIYGAVNPFVVEKGDIVQLVLNNFDAAIHPFHLHGHQFQVAERPSSGAGTFGGGTRNFRPVPMKRDVVAVNANSYVVIRWQADNPGVWLFHCHIEWHVVMGLIATIVEAPEDLRGLTIPADHQAACKVQNISTAGNAAGNTHNLTDLAGANTVPAAGESALYPKRGLNAVRDVGRELWRQARCPYVRRVSTAANTPGCS